MISRKKRAANKANARRSTGPRTPEGKAASSGNSRTHGLCSKDRLVANEDQEEFDVMEIKLQVDIHPHGELEQILFSEILTASWQLRRICRMETELSTGRDSYAALLDDENLQKKLDRLGRHHTRFERTVHRSLKELKALQTNRAQRQDAPKENADRPDLATAAKPKSKISERTQPDHDPDVDRPITEQEYAEMDGFFAKMMQQQAQANQKIKDEAA